MTTVVVRCSACQQLSRVAAEAVGLQVACPRCPATFVARPEPDAADPPIVDRADPGRVPVVRPRADRPPPAPPRPIVWESPEPVAPVVERIPPSGGLIALALIPFGIPLLWLLASAVTQREVVMSFAVPVAVAVGASGLAFGTALVDRWSIRTRVKAVVALLFLAFAVAGLLFLVTKEWMQDLRRVFNRRDVGWRQFETPKSDKHVGYSVKFPGRPVVEAESPVPGWENWQAHQHTDGSTPTAVVYLSATGPVPTDVAKSKDAEAWFRAVGEAIVASSNGLTLDSERKLKPLGVNVGCEYQLSNKDDNRVRIVRVYQDQATLGRRAVYLAVEGVFLPRDAVDVETFLTSLRIPFDVEPPRKKVK